MARSLISSEVFFAFLWDSSVFVPAYVGSALSDMFLFCISPRLAIPVLFSTTKGGRLGRKPVLLYILRTKSMRRIFFNRSFM